MVVGDGGFGSSGGVGDSCKDIGDVLSVETELQTDLLLDLVKDFFGKGGWATFTIGLC